MSQELDTGTSAEPEVPPTPLWRNADFIRLWVGAGVSRFGTCVTMVAYPLLVLWHTGSATSTGLVAFAAALPNFLVQLPAGALVDRWDRRKVMIWCDVISFFAVASVGAAAMVDWIWLPHLMVAAFVQVCLGIFYQLAERATVRNVVTPEQLPAAIAQNQVRGSAIGLLGQPGSSLLFTLAKWLPFSVNAIANLVALVFLLMIKRDLRSQEPAPKARLHVNIGEGVQWLWRRKFLRVMTGVFATSNLIFQVLTLTVMVIVHSNGAPPAVVGVVIGLGGVGGMLGALTSSWWSRRASLYRTAVLGHVVWTLLIPLIALSSGYVGLAAAIAGISFIANLFNVVAGVYQIQITPEPLQGRVNSVASFLSSGANALGSLAGGFLIDKIGTSWTVGVMTVVIITLTIAVASSSTVRNESRAQAETA